MIIYAFNNNVIKMNIINIINVKEEEENDLKYNKYIYEYNMSNQRKKHTKFRRVK